jgi:hypothetical protein
MGWVASAKQTAKRQAAKKGSTRKTYASCFSLTAPQYLFDWESYSGAMVALRMNALFVWKTGASYS